MPIRQVGFILKNRHYTVDDPCDGVNCTGEQAVAWMMHAGSWLVYWLDVLARTPASKRPGMVENFVNGSRTIVDRYWDIIDEQKAQEGRPENLRTYRQTIEGFAEVAEDARELAEALGSIGPTHEQIPFSWGNEIPQQRMPGRPIDEPGFWESLVEKFQGMVDDVVGVSLDIGKLAPWLLGAYVLGQIASLSRSWRGR